MERKLRILHTSSAGLLINIEENGLGVDVFSVDPEEIYPDTPKEVKQMLLDGIEHQRIRTLVFTHDHGDHFCLETVLEALKRNPRLKIISTESAIRRIREREPHAGELYAIPAEETRNVRMEIPGYRLEVFNSRHMGEQYAGVQNLAVLLETAGEKVFIPGDAWPDQELFERVALWSPYIDVMAAPFPLIGLPTTRRMLDRTLQLRNILAIHLPRAEKDGQNWLASAKTVCMRAKDRLPMPVFGEHLGKEYFF